MGIPLRKLWKNKPKQFGPFSVVQSALFHNAERMGIDPGNLILALPMWSPGSQYNYSSTPLAVTNVGFEYQENSLFSDNVGNDYLQVLEDLEYNHPGLTILFGVKKTSTTINRFYYDARATGAGTYSYYQNSTAPLRWGVVNLIVSGGLSTGVTHDIGIVDNGTNAIGYLDVKEQLTAASQSRSIGPNLWIGAPGSSGNQLDGSLYYFLIFKAALPDDKVLIIQDNPYQLWQPVPQKTYFLPLDAGGSATVTGTAITGGVTESEIVTGGDTIISTLTGETYVSGTTSEDAIVAGLNGGTSWNSEVRDNLDNTNIILSVGDTVATITLPATPGYSISANDTVILTIPAASLTTSTSEIVATPNIIVTNEGVANRRRRLLIAA